MTKLSMFLSLVENGKDSIEKILGRKIELHEDMEKILSEILWKRENEENKK